MSHTFEFAKLDSSVEIITLEPGEAVVFIGANGSGKTRLGVAFEEQLGSSARRIPAQRRLFMQPNVAIQSLDWARDGLWNGHSTQRRQGRYQGAPAIHQVDDFDFLLQALYAERNNIALNYYEASIGAVKPVSVLDQLKLLWEELLPTKELALGSSSIKVRRREIAGQPVNDYYNCTDMSDGERGIFYMLGQSLMAPSNCLMIIDEPENHVHKSILAKLWSVIERSRPDCSYVYITHDQMFAVEHVKGRRFYIKSYIPHQWDIEEIPSEIELPHALIAELVGSRKPILFVEGERGSLDTTIYSSVYSDRTIMPAGNCDSVIHAVTTLKSNLNLHWLTPVGIVDGDHRDNQSITSLQNLDVYVLPVAEVENVLLLPSVFTELAAAFNCPDVPSVLADMKTVILTEATTHLHAICYRYTLRTLDARLKRVEIIGPKDIMSLKTNFSAEVASIDPAVLYADFETKLQTYIAAKDVESVLRLFDMKGLGAKAASKLGIKHDQFLPKIRVILEDKQRGEKLHNALKGVLPTFSPGMMII